MAPLSDLATILDAIHAGQRAASFESRVLEFKQEKPTPEETERDVAEAAICLANGIGGTVVVGVSDRTTGPAALMGTALDPDRLRKTIHATTQPNLLVEVEAQTHFGVRLLVVLVPEGIEVYASASAGVVLGASGDDTATLLQYVDAALYRAKDAGRGRSEMFDQALATAAAERLDTVAGLHRALAEHELRAYYQPVVTLPEGRMVGVEALVRWEHPSQGLLGPVAFLDAAEDSGLMVPLGRFMLEQACTDVARWRRDHEEAASMTVHVNLSGRQLEHPDVCSDVESALAASGLPPDALVLEVTESVFVAEISGATARLAELKSLGVRLGLDDFGTGYSSLSFLASVPFDVLKIDKSFVDRLADGSSPVIEAVATLAAALGLELVAEGVEHQAQVGRLVGLGCRLAQGFYFSRPVDHVAIEAMVSSGGVPGRCMTE